MWWRSSSLVLASCLSVTCSEPRPTPAGAVSLLIYIQLARQPVVVGVCSRLIQCRLSQVPRRRTNEAIKATRPPHGNERRRQIRPISYAADGVWLAVPVAASWAPGDRRPRLQPAVAPIPVGCQRRRARDLQASGQAVLAIWRRRIGQQQNGRMPFIAAPRRLWIIKWSDEGMACTPLTPCYHSDTAD